MSNKRLASLLVLPALLILFGPVQSSAETCRSPARVQDASGGVLPGATITISGAIRVTSAEGTFCLDDLVPGVHTVVVALPGFVTRRVELTVPFQGPAPVELVLTHSLRSDVVVTATRTSRRLDDVPVRTEVISRDLMARSGARTLADAVEYTTGVRVENNCQNCNFSQIRLLGLEGPYTQILVEGQPVVSSLAQVYGIEQIPARMIERIEVVKGGGSALYGPGSVGGVVNIIPREPGRSGGLFELRSDTYGPDPNWSINGSADWVARDRQTLLTVFSQIDRIRPFDVDEDGFTEVSRRSLDTYGARLNRYQLEGRAKLTFDATFLHEDRRGGDRLDLPPDQASVAEAVESRRAGLSGTWFHSASQRFDYRVTLSTARTTRDSYYGTGGDPNAFGDSRSHVTIFDSQVNQYAGRHTVSWGAQFSTESLEDAQPAYDRRTDVAYRNTGLYAQDDWAFAPKWQLLYGLRGDVHSALGSFIVSPRVALMHSPVPALDLRFSIARGFRAPQIFDEDLHLSSVGGEVRAIIVNPDLREERSLNTMAGFEWKPELGRGQALIEVNGFHTGLDDLFNVREADDPSTDLFEFQRVNAGRADVYGVEFNAGWGIGDAFVLQGGVVEQRARFAQAEPDFGSRDFFRSPRRYANATLTWRAAPADLFAAVRYTGSMKAPHYAGFIGDTRLETTPGFVTVDLSIARTFKRGTAPGLTVGVAGRNITNAYQRDLDRGPLRDAAYVYGPRFPRSIGAFVRVER